MLIFAGGDPGTPGLLEDLPRPDLVVAADGGYDAAVDLGFAVDVAVGDMDSITAGEIPESVVIERHPADKDATDLELAIELAVRDSPARMVVVGGSGGRFDHELANASLLCSSRWGEIDEIDWVTQRGRAHVIRQRRLISADVGALISLIPMGGDAAGVSTRGLRWDLDNERLPAGVTRGVSNVFRSPVADIKVDTGCLLGILPVVG